MTVTKMFLLVVVMEALVAEVVDKVLLLLGVELVELVLLIQEVMDKVPQQVLQMVELVV